MSILRRTFWACSVMACLLGVTPAISLAQEEGFQGTKISPAGTPKMAEFGLVSNWSKAGEADQPFNAASNVIVQKVANYYFSLLTWDDFHEYRASVTGVPNASNLTGMDALLKEILGIGEEGRQSRLFAPLPLNRTTDADVEAARVKQVAYLKQAAPIYIKELKPVLSNSQRIARLNGARVLVRMAQWGAEDVVPELVNIINMPTESDAVKMVAVQGLGYIFALEGVTGDVRTTNLFKDKAGQTNRDKAIVAVYKWLEKLSSVPANEVNLLKSENIAAIRYLRREAIKTLGNTGRPAMSDANGNREVSIAEMLVKIVRNRDDEQLSPATDLRERYEATLALAKLSGKNYPLYQPDVSAHAMAKFVVDLATQANADTERKQMAYAFMADSLKKGFRQFAAGSGAAGPADAYIKKLINVETDRVLKYLDDSKVETTATSDLAKYVGENPPPSPGVYKDK